MSDSRWTINQLATEEVPCPLCHATTFTELCRTDRYDMNLVTVGCNGCGLVLSNPQPVESALDEFYTKHYRRYYQKVAVPTLDYIRAFKKDERAAYTAAFLRDSGAVGMGAAVLDIGASEGCILKALRDLQPDVQATAVEPNPEFGNFAKTHAGCELAANLDELRRKSRTFDLIILNHVFEHMANPVSYLADLAGLLTSRGAVYIDVPDLMEYKALDSIHIAHLYHFSQWTLAATAAAAGYKVVIMQRHAPVMHPKSIRTLLKPDSSVTAATLPQSQEGWDILRAIALDAGRWLRRDWPWHRRVIANLRERLRAQT